MSDQSGPSLKHRLEEFFAHVPSEDLPALRRHMMRGAPVAGLAAAGTVVIGALANILAGRAIIWRQLTLASGALLALGFLLYRSNRVPEKSRRPERLILMLAAVYLLQMCLGGWPAVDGVYDDLEYIFSVPLGIAAFMPWNPSYTLILGSLTLLAVAVAERLGISRMTVPLWKECEMMLLGIGIGMLANQVQRHLWRTLEQGRRQMAALDRVAGLGRLTAGLAHEVKTPIAATMNSLDNGRALANELLESIGHAGVTEADLREIGHDLQGAIREATLTTERVGQIIRRVREHTHGLHATSSAEFFVLDRARAIEGLVGHALVRSKGKLDFTQVAPEARLHGDVGKFDQILLNLVVNSIEASEQAGRGANVIVSTSHDPSGAWIIAVEDDGPGFKPEAREHLFQAMYTTKANGTGLGLAISRELAEGAFGGSLSLVPSERGARFELKCGEAAPESKQAAFAPSPARPARES